MIVAVQWTLTTPRGWVDLDVNTSAGLRRWEALAKKPVPTNTSAIDNTPGWVFDVCIQGVHLYGFDHIAIEPLPGDGIKAYAWNTDVDDPDPQAASYRWGEVWEFMPPAPDPAVGGQINTRQAKTVYTEQEPQEFEGQVTTVGKVPVRPWSEWVEPDAKITRHGIWVRDTDNWQKHFDVRAARSWKEWIR